MSRLILLILLFVLSFLRCQGAVEPFALAYSVYAPSVRVGHWSPKKGLGTHFTALCDARRMGATWQYTWHYNGDLGACPGENVPMVYNAYAQELLTGHWETLQGRSRYILGYNEPDREDQANITPEDAAVLA